MPWITIETSVELPTERRTAIAKVVTEAMAGLMGKRREVTALRFAVVETGAWFVDGAPVGEMHAAVDVKVTRGTNTVGEKAALLAALKEALAPVAEPSYLVIDEVDADSWGYGGVSQASRLFGGTPAR